MNIAELFVNLGIKGAEKTVGALGQVKKGLGEVGSMSIEAKAGILGAMYGLERMMAISGQAGTGLVNFAALTGLSAKGLQQWQYAARQAGVSAEEMTGSLKGVQNSMTNMLMGKGAPEGIALLSKAVGGLDPTKYKDTFYMMTKLQEGIQKMSPEMGQMVAKSFGVSEGVISAMHRNVFTPDMLKKAPTYSDGETKSLDKSNVAWANLGNKIEMAFGHFNAKHGQTMVGDISKVVDQVVRLAEAFERLSEKLKLFQLLGKVFDGWGMIFNGAANAVDDITKNKKGIGAGLWEKTKDVAKGAYEVYDGMQIDEKEQRQKMIEDGMAEMRAHPPSWLAPKVQAQASGTVNNTTNVNQTIAHHGDAKDTKAVKDVHKAAINHAYRQRPAQRQGS